MIRQNLFSCGYFASATLNIPIPRLTNITNCEQVDAFLSGRRRRLKTVIILFKTFQVLQKLQQLSIIYIKSQTEILI